jgi:hypothetical protein
MQRYVARANVDHYLNLLNGDLTAHNRSTIATLLVREEDKLCGDLQNLEFAETRASNGRDRLNKLKRLRNTFALGTAERAQADDLIIVCEKTQTLLEGFCHQMRDTIDRGGL